MTDKLHKNLIRDIRGYIATLNELKIEPVDFFYPSDYVDSKGEMRSGFNLTKKGCEFVAHKLTGKKGVAFTSKYINRFHEMESALAEQSNPRLPSNYIEALEQLLMTARENEQLVAKNEELAIGLDKYQRFLCEKTQELKKSELAVKLDTSPQRLASRLKKIGVYTDRTSKVSQRFLDKYPDVKIIMEHEVRYTINEEEKVKQEWQWTHEGAKAVVDELLQREMVVFTENEGFKLK